MGSKTDIRVEMIECACGCGTILNKYNGWYETRKYVSGHNGRIYKNVTKKEANKLAQEKHYKLHGTTNKLNARAKRAKDKEQILMYRGTYCYACKLEYDGTNGAVFELHHVNPKNKLFNVGTNAVVAHTWEEIKAEADKCVVLCANCHRLHHNTDQVPITEKDLIQTNTKPINVEISLNKANLLKNNTSGFRGVTQTRNNKWKASISHCNKVLHLGTFDTAKLAATAYDNYIIVNKLTRPLNFPSLDIKQIKD